MADEAETSDPRPVDAVPTVAAGRWSGGRTTVLLGAAVALAVVLGAGIASVATRPEAPAGQPLPVGDGAQLLEDRPAADEPTPLPDVTLEGFTDGAAPVRLADYRGTPLLLNFWASWCAPCVAEMPDFQELHEQAAGAVNVLGVNVQDAPSNAEAFAESLQITYDLARDPAGELYTRMQSFGMPTTLFVDSEGTVVFRRTGLLDGDQLRALVADHFGIELD
jgi:cytochrome c biogenesis protein CcmG, thiol:disulfide interchange protein DsbE